MTDPAHTNQITGDLAGSAVQADTADTVHAPTVTDTATYVAGPRTEQDIAVLNHFAGPVDARGAHFGPRYDTGGDPQ